MKVYIVGVISKGGTLSPEEINENLQRFQMAETHLRAQGYDIFSPTYHVPGFATQLITYESWIHYMKLDIAELMACDAIYLLPGWEESRGARLEVHIARELGYQVIIDDFFTQ
jgi:Domain of unknown function (DUF4406)